MKNKQTQIDTGNNVLFIEHEFGRHTDATIFTCYINSVSIRSSSLHIPRIRETFISAVITACKLRYTVGEDSIATHITQEVDRYIDQALTTTTNK
jgi:hypothetical protein